ncbi:hypothetical protein [Halalkalibacter okhensis]|uniref:Uncharacterized protein n=1 Tax=Halalkalibacter okhensis TaxID=333138 RepID=A0A0B0IDI3_9BACI|nr:hypothetical protein [Halalkalibacter okhensis]KHF38897.1 hypothetical protein LQ50_18365 [Halalkalibacter okhensis]
MMLSLFLLMIIILIIIAIVKGVGIRQYRWFFEGGRTKWFLAGYVLLLIISFCTYQLIPKEKEVIGSNISQLEEEQFYNDFHDAALKGELHSFDGAVRAEEWVFDYDEPKLHLKSKYSNPISVSVITEQKPTNDKTIEAYYYTGVSTSGNIDITDAISRIDLELHGTTLELMRAEVVDKHFAQFIQEFTIGQFYDQQSFLNGHHTHIAPEILILKIPEGLEVVDYANVLR